MSAADGEDGDEGAESPERPAFEILFVFEARRLGGRSPLPFGS